MLYIVSLKQDVTTCTYCTWCKISLLYNNSVIMESGKEKPDYGVMGMKQKEKDVSE